MERAVRGIFENGRVTLTEKPPVDKRTEVVVTFLEEPPISGKRRAGVFSGKVVMSEDFDDPLDDLKDYM